MNWPECAKNGNKKTIKRGNTTIETIAWRLVPLGRDLLLQPIDGIGDSLHETKKKGDANVLEPPARTEYENAECK